MITKRRVGREQWGKGKRDELTEEVEPGRRATFGRASWGLKEELKCEACEAVDCARSRGVTEAEEVAVVVAMGGGAGWWSLKKRLFSPLIFHYQRQACLLLIMQVSGYDDESGK